MAGLRVIGMSGWLPFAEILDPTVVDRDDGGENEDDIFGSDGGDRDEIEYKDGEDMGKHYLSLSDFQRTAANMARDIVSLPPLSAV